MAWGIPQVFIEAQAADAAAGNAAEKLSKNQIEGEETTLHARQARKIRIAAGKALVCDWRHAAV